MTHLWLIILVVITFEIIIFFKLINLIKLNIYSYKNLLSSLFEKNIEDSIKQDRILTYSKKLFLSSLKILFCIFVIFILFFATKFIINDLYNFILSFIGILETTILFITYSYLRKFFNAKL